MGENYTGLLIYSKLFPPVGLHGHNPPNIEFSEKSLAKLLKPTNGVNLMNMKRFIFATIAAFIFVGGFEFLVHGVLLSETYQQTQNLWRTKEGSEQYFHFMLMSQFGFAMATTFFFTRFCNGGCLLEGARFGIYLGLVIAAIDLGSYCYMPIPLTLTFSWMTASLFKAVGTGVVLGLVYRK
jgi:hypothetical protein